MQPSDIQCHERESKLRLPMPSLIAMARGDVSRTVAAALLLVIVSSFFSGCATVGDLSRTNPDPLFVSPSSAQSLPDDAKNLGDGTQCEKDWLKRQIAAMPSDTDRFAVAMSCSLRGGAPEHARFVQVGRMLASRQCDIFLDSLEDKRLHTAYNQTNMNTLIAAAAAVLARGGHHATSVFNLATGATAANALIDNYRANYVMTQSLFQLRKKLLEGRESLDKEMDRLIASQAYTSFDDAKQDLLDYGDWCSHKTLVNIVNSALAETRLTMDTPEKSLAATTRQALFDRAKAKDSAGITGKNFTERQFAFLFALSIMDTKARVAAVTALNKTTAEIVDGATVNKSGWEKPPISEPALAAIVKALELGATPAGDSAAQQLLDVGRATGYAAGVGNTERDQLAAATGKPAAAATPPAAPATAVAPRLGSMISNARVTAR